MVTTKDTSFGLLVNKLVGVVIQIQKRMLQFLIQGRRKVFGIGQAKYYGADL